MTDEEIRSGIEDLHADLAATMERPIERTAANWLAEAEAITRDLVETDASHQVLQKRLSQVQELLENVDETGDPAADEHVATAEELVAELRSELDDVDDQ